DQYDNPVSAPVSVQITATGTAGTLSATSANLPGPGAAATFTAVQTGVEQVTVTPVGEPGMAPITVDFRVIASAADVAAGKGYWLLQSDLQKVNQQSLLSELKAAGVTHVYLEVEETSLGFYGSSSLRHFLYAAHDSGIAVIAWVFPYLYNVGYDISLTRQVAAYTAPTGDRPDAIAADMEENISPSAVGQYAQAVRQAMGPQGVFIAVTYPPIYHESYPYAALGPLRQPVRTDGLLALHGHLRYVP
ncbi:copper amine oxidase domain protein, partial [mine drainage metagenome]